MAGADEELGGSDSADLTRPSDRALGPGSLESIGPYRILEVLGEGGMGTVYLTEQKEPIRRRVAVKVIKLGMDSEAVLARFELEWRALAIMNHDAIAKIFDAGTTERGQPYFVMEYAEGKPLTDYCNERREPLHERIQLFQRICAGVEHAHQKGVLHRDIKPDNILVARKGGQHTVKIIDFGIARATDRQWNDATFVTSHGTFLGTPEYMSPEQASAVPDQVDTRSDIYSLGAVLYELLSGELPFSRAELQRAGALRIQKLIREQEPPKPSTKLSKVVGEAADHANRRRVSLHVLKKELRGDLDWIVMKALAKEPERRYESAHGLAADLSRYLQNEPVLAGPPRIGYRLGKFVKRHRALSIAGGLVAVALLVGLVASVMLWRSAQTHLDRFDMLSTTVMLDEALAASPASLPPHPKNVAAFENWLTQHVEPVEARRSQVRDALAAMRVGALAYSDDEKQKDIESHPEFGRLQAAREIMRARASSKRSPATREPQPAWSEWSERDLERAFDKSRGRSVALAQYLVQRSVRAKSPRLPVHYFLLARSLLGAGEDEATRLALDSMCSSAPENWQPYVQRLRDKTLDELAAAESSYADLEARVGQRRTWTLADPDSQFLHDAISRVSDRARSFATTEVDTVRRRLRWAKGIEGWTRNHPHVTSSWSQAARAIEQADGVTASELYRSDPPLRLVPQVGLVPIGMNPVTRLWEFYDLRSAVTDEGTAQDVKVPEHGERGELSIGHDTGMVFVLVPGGKFKIGSEGEPMGQRDELPSRELELAPFFLSRFEMTQGQWIRLAGQNPSDFGPGHVRTLGFVSLAHPVENINWIQATDLLQSFGMDLPTEAQWEYACRAGTRQPYSCGVESSSLRGYANIADLAYHRAGGTRYESWLDDVHAIHSPVGSFLPNPFGLHDMHGNVAEFCRDWYRRSYSAEFRGGDGLQVLAPTAGKIVRGGNSASPAELVRCAARVNHTVAQTLNTVGVRPIRWIDYP